MAARLRVAEDGAALGLAGRVPVASGAVPGRRARPRAAGHHGPGPALHLRRIPPADGPRHRPLRGLARGARGPLPDALVPARLRGPSAGGARRTSSATSGSARGGSGTPSRRSRRTSGSTPVRRTRTTAWGRRWRPRDAWPMPRAPTSGRSSWARPPGLAFLPEYRKHLRAAQRRLGESAGPPGIGR